MVKSLNLKCYICGQPATCAVQDVIETPCLETDVYRKYEPHGKPIFFCQKHERQPEYHNGTMMRSPKIEKDSL